MYFKDIGYLMSEKQTIDSMHRPKVSYSESKVYCNVKSISQSEFYQVATVGFKPEIKIEIKCMDITGATHFKYNGKIYKILRTYSKQDIIELTLTSMVVENE
jgi:SPP1 family predicted phage head-tail adaptor